MDVKGSTRAKKGRGVCAVARIEQGLKDMVSNCQTCCKMQCQLVELLIVTPLLTFPLQKVRVDHFEYKNFLLEYFSLALYEEIAKLTSSYKLFSSNYSDEVHRHGHVV